jgi:hypothetical protein
MGAEHGKYRPLPMRLRPCRVQMARSYRRAEPENLSGFPPHNWSAIERAAESAILLLPAGFELATVLT